MLIGDQDILHKVQDLALYLPISVDGHDTDFFGLHPISSGQAFCKICKRLFIPVAYIEMSILKFLKEMFN